MPTNQLNEVLARTNGDMKLIEKELGLPAGAWQGQGMAVIEVSKPNVKMPTGNESGANPLWKSGGKLPTGHMKL